MINADKRNLWSVVNLCENFALNGNLYGLRSAIEALEGNNKIDDEDKKGVIELVLVTGNSQSIKGVIFDHHNTIFDYLLELAGKYGILMDLICKQGDRLCSNAITSDNFYALRRVLVLAHSCMSGKDFKELVYNAEIPEILIDKCEKNNTKSKAVRKPTLKPYLSREVLMTSYFPSELSIFECVQDRDKCFSFYTQFASFTDRLFTFHQGNLTTLESVLESIKFWSQVMPLVSKDFPSTLQLPGDTVMCIVNFLPAKINWNNRLEKEMYKESRENTWRQVIKGQLDKVLAFVHN
jgi:hypothetical protein